jgi:hypothetical protein
MHLTRAQQQKIGNLVACPKDRREPGFTGKVAAISPIIATNADGEEYVWIEVQHPFTGRKSQWPSNRLGAFQ